MKLRFRNIIKTFLVVIAGFLLNSCTDDSLPDIEGGATGNEEGETIALTLSLQSLTRDGETLSDFEKYEDYIDPGKLILLFFYADDDDKYDTLIRQYGPSELEMIPIEDSMTGDLRNWYVKLPVLDENDGFAEVLRNHDFKVAALVNWQSEKLSLLEDAQIENNEITTHGSHIRLLHHLAEDPLYQGSPYGFLNEGSERMGLHSSWVKVKFSDLPGRDKPYAFDWIRNNIYPNSNHDTYIPDDSNPENFYKNLRLVWNFNAAMSVGNTNYDPKIDFKVDNKDIAESWANKNYESLNSWLKIQGEDGRLEKLEPLKVYDDANFEFVATEKGEDQHPNQYYKIRYAWRDFQSNKYGIVLHGGGNYNENAFRFNLLTSGTIIIDWERMNNTGKGKVIIERRKHYDEADDSEADQPIKYTLDYVGDLPQYFPGEFQSQKEEIRVTGDSEYISIYAEGGDVIIYSIEYVQDIYLYETDRDGIRVSKENPIPMYGIQKYTKLGNYWKKGMLFNLSDFNNLSLLESQYPDYQKISLIRSVAKVELRLPETFNAHNVYLRCSNTDARFEPLDVSTPTNTLWKDYEDKKYPENWIEKNYDPLGFEFDNINKAMKDKMIDPFFGGRINYQNALAWYYGDWASLGQVFGVDVPQTGENYPNPRILNPRIERTDFVRFIKVGQAEGIYTKYILYVPEKFIDDPEIAGDTESSPKLCHIEFRRGKDEIDNVEKEDPSLNVDDDYCFRIYFTKDGFFSNGGKNSYPSFRREVLNPNETEKPTEYGNYITWENSYENNIDNIRNHWPIIRNNLYSFVVEDAKQKVLVMNLKVLPWRMVTENSYEW